MRLHGRAVSAHAEGLVLRRFSGRVRSRFSWCAKAYSNFLFLISACRNCAVYSELSSISQIRRVNVFQQKVSFSSTKKEHMLKSWRREGKKCEDSSFKKAAWVPKNEKLLNVERGRRRTALHPLLEEPPLVGAVGARLEGGRRRAVVCLVHRLNTLLARHVVQTAALNIKEEG